jgi:hypothetical protein
MKAQNITGGFLFLIGTISLLFFTNFGHVDSAIYLGRTFADTIILLIPVLLILVATPYRKKVALVLLLGSSWLISSTVASIELYRKGSSERVIVHDFEGLVDAFSNNKEIPIKQNSPQNLSFIDLMQNYMSRGQSIRNEYSRAIEAAGLADMLTPQNLTNPETLKNSLEVISTLEKMIPTYESRLINELNTIEMQLSERQDKESIDALNGFQKSKGDGVRLLKMYYQNQGDIIRTMGKIISLAIELKGKLQLQDKQLLFEDQKSLDLYNSYLQQLTKFSKEEEEISLYQQQQFKSKTDKLKELK